MYEYMYEYVDLVDLLDHWNYGAEGCVTSTWNHGLDMYGVRVPGLAFANS